MVKTVSMKFIAEARDYMMEQTVKPCTQDVDCTPSGLGAFCLCVKFLPFVRKRT